MKFTYKTNEEGWKLERILKDQGYIKVSDCYWYQIMKRGEKTIELERE